MKFLIVVLTSVLLSGCFNFSLEGWIHDDVDQEFTNKEFTSEQIHQDIDFLVETMRQRHPAYALYVDEPALLQKVADIKSQITDGFTRQEAFTYIAQLTPFFNDGHSILFPLLAELTYAEESGVQVFPFGVKVRNQQIFLASAYTRMQDNFSLPSDTEITAINGVSASSIVAKLAKMSHGETPELRESVLGLLFHYWLYAVYDVKGDISISCNMQGESKELLLANEDQWEPAAGELKDYSLDLLAGNVGYLRIGTFDVANDMDSYKKFVAAAFEELSQKQVQKLIIDVRGNTGGQSDAGAEVIQYLINAPVSQASYAIEKLNADTNGLFGYKGKPGEIKELSVESDGMVKPVTADKRYQGEVVVLIDRLSYSATILFSATILDHGIARLAGEPTGGFANQTGNLAPFYLPNSKLLMLAPGRYIIRPSGDRNNTPVIPHIELHKNQLAKSDAWLGEALTAISTMP
ncbi:MAG: hypothetical protein GJ680_15955 [Alteromonadaceae bacterium]|nr:hypothetical protein [Alteromonadaceae bacterium]